MQCDNFATKNRQIATKFSYPVAKMRLDFFPLISSAVKSYDIRLSLIILFIDSTPIL